MEKLQFKIDINASKEKVWNTITRQDLQNVDGTFMEGSYYSGDWNKTENFISSRWCKASSGIVGIKDNKLHEFISIEHLGSDWWS
jgi:hypothetical protein